MHLPVGRYGRVFFLVNSSIQPPRLSLGSGRDQAVREWTKPPRLHVPCSMFAWIDTAAVTSRARPRLPQSKLETHRLWHEDGLSVDAVAEVRCNKANTVRGYLAGEWFLSEEHNGVSKQPDGASLILLGFFDSEPGELIRRQSRAGGVSRQQFSSTSLLF